MKLHDLSLLYSHHPCVGALAQFMAGRAGRQLQVRGLMGSAAPMAVAALVQRGDVTPTQPLLVVMDDEEEAGYFYHDLMQILGEGEQAPLFFPSSYKRAVKYGQRDAASEIMRTEVLSALSTGQALVVVTTPQALAEKVVNSQVMHERTMEIGQGTEHDMTLLQEILLEWGFCRRDYVYEPGQFAVRGSIMDIFSFSCEEPYRLDFFGDEVEGIRTFDVDTQLSHQELKHISIVPQVSQAVGQGSQGQTFLQSLPTDAVLVSHSLQWVCDVVERVCQEGFVPQATEAAQAEDILPNAQALLVDAATLRTQAMQMRHIALLRGIEGKEEPHEGAVIAFRTHAQPAFHKNFDLVIPAFRQHQEQGFRIYILADSAKQNERLRQILLDKQSGIAFTAVDHALHCGFSDEDMKACIYTDHQIFDRFHKYSLRSDRARTGRVAVSLKELQQFRPGDYVVHIDHGIGRFCGLVRIPEGGQMQEMIKLEYSHGDTVMVSIHSLHKVSRYKGREGEQPRISTLGTGAWDKMKDRTKKKIKDIARDLILLYSRRHEEKGFAFSPDSYLQRELETSFRYEDTPDQLKATQDVKRDMESTRPMDRLVCGDVGFGKTEVAIRAAFKACADGKQVAVLVPTTVLAYQHYRAFSERLKQMPVRIEYLSRARTAAQTKAILADLAQGRVDILIGTHKLIGKSVKWHSLGLLIIDEEQKFGVSTKEKLRQLRTNVDTLTLTATPIPRTLQFSLMGARDMSVIQTPPPNRRPIHTRICTFGAEPLAEAISFEMSRNGQVYVVSHRISQLAELADMVRKYVPDARVAIGHGQMPPEQLEEVMLQFSNHDVDVLVSTAIIESGIDIPNANTIIICGAHHFGLCDLHQMRGRVGRSNRKAFCLLMAPPLASLPDETRRRLQAIEDYSDLGSGIHIAMQDLDIRGAGNLLGAEQSGFIADLGYETYKKILQQAVRELRETEFGQLFAEQTQSGEREFVEECTFETDIPLSFAESYVPTAPERMMLYRELDALDNHEQVEAFCRRMQDRFGPIPAQSRELVQVVLLRQLGRHFGSERIVLKHQRLRLYFAGDQHHPFYASTAFGQIITYATAYPRRCQLEQLKGRNTLLITDVDSVSQAVDLLTSIQELK